MFSDDDFNKAGVPESWNCIDCGMNTGPGIPTRTKLKAASTVIDNVGSATASFDDASEIYHVRNPVWRKAGNPDGCLCIGCLERRIGRRLTPKDFPSEHSLNRTAGTPRLLERRWAPR